MSNSASHPAFPKHFDGKGFFNPNGFQARGFADVLQWQLKGKREPSPSFIHDVKPSKPPSRVESGQLLATLVNHSTVLLQQGDSNILTDPIWSKRASPVSFMGPHRRREPGVRAEDLPEIDIVLLSHNHYDHLDLPTLRWLAKRRDSTYIVPIGVGKLLRAEGIKDVHELDWGEAWTQGKTTISAVPALHFSARGILDRNQTLWCGYVIDNGNGIVYFAGDTGFGDHFAQIHARFGSPRLALLPIGAYEPRWFMSPVHMGPDEALKAHGILNAAASIAIHHGTFQLADDGLDTPRQVILNSAPPKSFFLLENGQSASIDR